MISFRSIKLPGIVLASAGILLHAHSALAADVVGDAQMQARNLLSGTVAARSKTAQVAPATSADDTRAFNVEPQEQARQLILGKPSGDRVADRLIGSEFEMQLAVRSANVDPQEAARRLLAKGA
jgi:hypothetical protein